MKSGIHLSREAKNVPVILETILQGLKGMLAEFGVRSKIIKEREEYKNAKGEISIRLRLVVSNRPGNLLNLYSRVGFEYNKKRAFFSKKLLVYP